MSKRQCSALREANKVEILSLIDNALDLLSSIDKEQVQSVRKWTKEKKQSGVLRLPLAEHGFSMFIRVFSDIGVHSILFDTGSSPEGVVVNADGMGVNLSDIEAVVLSHGHPDHSGGLLSVVKTVEKPDLSIVVHEDMFKVRGMVTADGTVRRHQPLPLDDEVKPARYVRTKQPYLLADNTVLVTGEIPSQTSFEKGLPTHRTLIDGKWEPEPWLRDDRAIVINLRQKGLIVLSGCGHSGIINTVLYAKQITKIDEVYAIMGGFHLAGKEHESRISQTVDELKRLKPKLIAPSHCTGWRGIYAIYQAMPQAFIWNSVGNLYRFQQKMYNKGNGARRVD
jgi:7,8-dihydropterin-6-yl-methyl-4-(beta-D-ribofuranosyl)aminobenzene 5'-phosphate synthase